MEPPPQYEPITTLGKLGDYSGVPFFGSFRGSGNMTGIGFAVQYTLATRGGTRNNTAKLLHPLGKGCDTFYVNNK